MLVKHFNIKMLYVTLLKIETLRNEFMEPEKLKAKKLKEKAVKSEMYKTAHSDSLYDDAILAEQEQFARAKLRELKKFYTDLLIYGVVCLCSIIVWLSMGAGTFWPIWVIIGCGINIGLRAITLGQIPMLEEFFPFLGNAWEETQLEKVLNRSVRSGSGEEQYSEYDPNYKSD